MTLLIIGASGLLGAEVFYRFSRKDGKIIGTYYSYPFSTDHMQTVYMDLADSKGVRAVLEVTKPDRILISGAMKDVDRCEAHPDQAHRVNVVGTETICQWASQNGSSVCFVSTDYVFDGVDPPDGGYTDTSATNPVNTYGRTKRDAEKIVLDMGGCVVRVALLFGNPRIERTNNFALFLLDKIASGDVVYLYDDVVTTPTYVPWAAMAIQELIEADASGIYHLTGSEAVSRFDYGMMIASEFQGGSSMILKKKFKPGNGIAPRPQRSPLRPSDILKDMECGPMPPLETCIAQMVRDYRKIT